MRPIAVQPALSATRISYHPMRGQCAGRAEDTIPPPRGPIRDMPDREVLLHNLDTAARHMETYQRINALLRRHPLTKEGHESLRLNEELIRITEIEMSRLRSELGMKSAAPN